MSVRLFPRRIKPSACFGQKKSAPKDAVSMVGGSGLAPPVSRYLRRAKGQNPARRYANTENTQSSAKKRKWERRVLPPLVLSPGKIRT